MTSPGFGDLLASLVQRREPPLPSPLLLPNGGEGELFMVGWLLQIWRSYGAGRKSGKWKAEVEKIEPAQVRRMIAVLDEKCRDVEF